MLTKYVKSRIYRITRIIPDFINDQLYGVYKTEYTTIKNVDTILSKHGLTVDTHEFNYLYGNGVIVMFAGLNPLINKDCIILYCEKYT